MAKSPEPRKESVGPEVRIQRYRLQRNGHNNYSVFREVVVGRVTESVAVETNQPKVVAVGRQKLERAKELRDEGLL